MNSSRRIILLDFLRDCNLYQKAFINDNMTIEEYKIMIDKALDEAEKKLEQVNLGVHI